MGEFGKFKINDMKDENYIGSQQHWEDSVNADYDRIEYDKQFQEDTREQIDDRQPQCPETLRECEYSCTSKCFLIE